MPAKKKEAEGDIVMHVHERKAVITVKETRKVGEDYHSREVSLEKPANNGSGEAYEVIIETMRGLQEIVSDELDDYIGDAVFEKKTSKEKVEETFGDEVEELEVVEATEELEVIEPEEEEERGEPPFSPYFIANSIWYHCDSRGKKVKIGGLNGGNPIPVGTSWEDNKPWFFKWQKSKHSGKMKDWPLDVKWDAYYEMQKYHRQVTGKDYVYEPRS